MTVWPTLWQWDNSDPYGNNPPNQNPSGQGTFDFDLRYPGQVTDTETNTFYNINRDYDPSTGRYIESDLIGLAAGINTYTYVLGNPLTWIDPTGLASSGLPIQVPGTNNTVRIDNPHVPGQQEHAHIYDKNGNLLTAINKDGTGSHGQCPTKLPKNKKLIAYLIGEGFKLGALGDILILRDLVNNVGAIVDPMNPFFNQEPDSGFGGI